VLFDANAEESIKVVVEGMFLYFVSLWNATSQIKPGTSLMFLSEPWMLTKVV
jgi:hypothetical protein